ncbi:MAG TPA: two-component system response regulator [Acidobacteria bacterium]|nr:two-component system response regulator [Acidobacteriota bacterium]
MATGHILVVEDSPTERQLIQRMLEEKGHRVLAAADGDEALASIGRERPALILLDVVLPGTNGFQICRQIKNAPETRDIRIVLVTSKNQDVDRFWGMKQGADEYLTKPFKSDELLACVKRQMP